MLKNKLLLLFSIVFISLLLIPSVFGADNETDILDSSSDTQPIGNDIYFDANASDDEGNGTIDHPYKNLRDGEITDNDVVHLKNGNYDICNSALTGTFQSLVRMHQILLSEVVAVF